MMQLTFHMHFARTLCTHKHCAQLIETYKKTGKEGFEPPTP